MMTLCVVTLAAALLPGAFAIPADDGTAMHRALQTAVNPNEDFVAQLRAATTVDANGDHHL